MSSVRRTFSKCMPGKGTGMGTEKKRPADLVHLIFDAALITLLSATTLLLYFSPFPSCFSFSLLIRLLSSINASPF